MDEFKNVILESKKVSIWGIGYLGYTTILKLQEYGFRVTLFDYTESRLTDLQKGVYPGVEQITYWSKTGKIPSLDLTKIEFAKNINELFYNSIHIISFPSDNSFSYEDLSELFIKNKDKLKNCLVIFLSASSSTGIDNFIKKLEKNKITIHIGTSFRDDWTIEEFLDASVVKVVSGNSEAAAIYTESFFRLMEFQVIKVKNIKEAVIYENVKNALNYTVMAFFNQLSLAFPDVNIQKLFSLMMSNCNFKKLLLGVSGVDYKSEQAIENLLESDGGNYLTILKESNRINISFLFKYAESLVNRGVESVTVLGLSSFGTMKDLRFSPSVILAEYLNRLNIKVFIHDDNFNGNEVSEILPFCFFTDIYNEKINTDAIIAMSLCEGYKFFTQKDIKKKGFLSVKFFIDNTGFFKNFTFNEKTVYHQFCDGNLKKL